MDSKQMLMQAIELHKKNQFIDASDIYKKIIFEDQNNHHARHYLGVLYMQNGFMKEGIELINSAIALVGFYPEAVHNLKVFGHSTQAKVSQEINSIKKSTQYPKYKGETLDAWRMERMLDFAKLFAGSSNEKWLTIGDAFGHDAQILKNSGIANVVASNLDSDHLALGKESGDIDDYLTINAEKIELSDGSFDYILCKEALHHMPRPYVAIYEMLRVSKKFIFLVEPLDTLIDYDKPEASSVKRTKYSDDTFGYLKEKICYSWVYPENESNKYEVFADWYEDGAFNYVYTLSAREIKKICFGMGLPGYAIKSFNDYYDPNLNQQNIEESRKIELNKEQLRAQDIFCEMSGKPPSYITCILFKEFPSQDLINKLRELNFDIYQTPTMFMPFLFVNAENS